MQTTIGRCRGRARGRGLARGRGISRESSISVPRTGRLCNIDSTIIHDPCPCPGRSNQTDHGLTNQYEKSTLAGGVKESCTGLQANLKSTLTSPDITVSHTKIGEGIVTIERVNNNESTIKEDYESTNETHSKYDSGNTHQEAVMAQQSKLSQEILPSAPDEVTSISIVAAQAINASLSTDVQEKNKKCSSSATTQVCAVSRIEPVNTYLGQMRDCAKQVHYVNKQPVKKGPKNYYGNHQPPYRPDHGNDGYEIELVTNYFPVHLPNCLTIHHYDVAMVPEKLPKLLSREVYEHFQKLYLPNIGAYDGSKSVYYTQSQFSDLKMTKTFIMNVDDREQPREFTITLQKVAQFDIDINRLHEMLQDMSETMPALQAIDVILRHLPSLKMQLIGHSFFSKPQQTFFLGSGRELWPGYYQSVKPVMGWKMMLNIDTAATAFHSEQSVFDFLCLVLRDNRSKDANKSLTDKDRQKFERRELTDSERSRFSKEIKGLKIKVTHLPYPRKYKVIGVSRNSARTLKFPIDNGSILTVEKYFNESYASTSCISHPLLPCLQVGQKERNINLPIDVCMIVSQKCAKKLTDNQTASMIRYTAKPAHERKKEIMEAVKHAGFGNDIVLKEFGIKVTTSMVEVTGRVLNPPILEYRGRKLQPQEGKGCWDIKGHKLFKGVAIANWVIICSIYKCNDKDCHKFSCDLQRQANIMGMDMKRCGGIKHVDKTCTMKAALNEAMTYFGSTLDLVIAIIEKKGSSYQDVKLFGDSNSGKAVATQCVLDSTVQRKCNPPTLGNICLKINAKLGGSNSIVDLGTRPPVIRGMPIIIFGADVTHPRSDDTTSPSIASVVASVDLEGGKYRALHRNQKHRQEIIADLAAMAKDHLRAFRRATGEKPVKIIFYRDGVSDGQFAAVRLEEVSALQQACMELQRDYWPKITFIVVQKRHHTKFFPKNRQDACGKGSNIPPGTMVDCGITHPTQFDFYLCSHAAIQGTSRPCHYHVLWDDSDFTANELQCFSYQLCHMFWRCNRSVSYPAPTYYAHHDAAHARMLLQAATDTSSSGTDSSGSSGTLSTDDMDQAIKIHEKRINNMYFI